jgi:hypothetical protein
MAVDLSDVDAVEALISARGNLHLAAERTGLSHAQLINKASDDLPRLQRELKTRTIIDAFSLVDVFKLATMQRLHELEAADVAKTFTTLVQLLKDLTDDKVHNLNVNEKHEYYWQQLPADVRQAIIEVRAELEPALIGAPSDNEQPHFTPTNLVIDDEP